MNHSQSVEKPQNRSTFRRKVGKEYFILKRRFNWLFEKNNFASIDPSATCDHSLIRHQSFLLRPLKDVEMYLQYNKITNLKLAVSKLNHVVLRPGQTCSIWYMVGRPTSKKGYLEGLTLENGKISKGIGGGLCQLGNLLYWMTLHTPLTVKERYRHGYDVFPDVNRTIPFACGATLSYNYIDLQIQNNTEDTFRINLWLDEAFLNGEIMCDKPVTKEYQVYETDHVFTQQWWGGYTRHNKIWKKITDLSTGEETTELVAVNNAIMMYSPLIDTKK